MPSPSLPDRCSGTYDRLYGLAKEFTVEFGTSAVRLASEKHNGTDRIYNDVDDAYVEGVGTGLEYDEVQVLAAIAVIKASEFDVPEDTLRTDRSFDD